MPIPPPPPPPPPPPVQPFFYLSFGAAKQELANRLYDSNKVFWPDNELAMYLTEALRTWNAMTGYWRADFTFQTKQNVIWYNLLDTNSMPNSQVAAQLQDTDLYPVMLAHLLEPPQTFAPAWVWSGSSQFSVADFSNAMQRRLSELLAVTGCVLAVSQLPALPGRMLLPDNVVDVYYAAYLPGTSTPLPVVLFKEDIWAAQSYNPGYLQQPSGLPSIYMESSQPPITFDTDRAPGFGGTYEMLLTFVPNQWAVGTYLTIPNDWTWVLKWGALADMLSRESNAKDVVRSQYCEQRYRMGLGLLQKAPTLLALRIGNVPVQIDTLSAAQFFNPSWRAASQGKPTAAYYAGLNVLALNPPPDNGAGNGYSCTATVVSNAVIPTNNTDLIQVGREDMDMIIDYAQHLAAFKMGGEEFTRTIQLFERFMTQVSIYGLELNEWAEYTHAIYGLAAAEKRQQPLMQPDTMNRGGPEQ